MSENTRRFLASVLAPLLGLSAACSEASAPAVTTVDSAGIEIRTSRGPGWKAADAWRLELDLQIGDVDGPDAFGRLADVAPRRDGGVWVVDRQSRLVRAYDERGSEVLAFGGPGEGPGEFRSVGRLIEHADGSVSVGGRMPLELYRFDDAGRPLGVDTVPSELYRDSRTTGPGTPPLGPTMGEWAFAADGSAFLQAVTMDMPGNDIVRSDVLLRIESEDRPGVRFARWEAPALRGGPGGAPHLLQPTASWSPVSDGGVWFSPGHAYELRRFDGAGNLRSILRRPGSRSRITGAVKAAFLASLERETDNPAMLAMLERAVFPDSLPATAGVWASEGDGHLWVGVIDPQLPWRLEAPNAWDVFAADGAYVGRLAIPVGLRPTRIITDYVYGTWQDELEVAHARRYRIVRNE